MNQWHHMPSLSLNYVDISIPLFQKVPPGSCRRHNGKKETCDGTLQPDKQHRLWRHQASIQADLQPPNETLSADRGQEEVLLTSRAASRSAPRSSITRTTSLWPICEAIHKGAVPSCKQNMTADGFTSVLSALWYFTAQANWNWCISITQSNPTGRQMQSCVQTHVVAWCIKLELLQFVE